MFLGCLHASLSEKPLIHLPIKNTVLRATRTKRTHFLVKASLHKLPLNRETVLKLFSVHTKLHRIFKASHFHIIPIEYTTVRVQTCGSESFQK